MGTNEISEEKSLNIIYNAFLFGFFTDFLKSSEDLPDSSLKDFCRLESLFWLNDFDEYFEYIKELSSKDASIGYLLEFNFKLFTLNLIPKIYVEKIKKSDNYEYQKEFKSLLPEFYRILEKPLDKDISTFCLKVLLDIFCYILGIAKNLFSIKEIPFSEYIKLKTNIFTKVQQIESEFQNQNFDSEEYRIWQALIYKGIADVYSYYDEFSHMERLYYEKSLSVRENIFALLDLVDYIYSDDDKYEAWNYLKNFEKYFNYEKVLNETKYLIYFDTKAQFSEYQSKQELKDNYLKAIRLIEKMKYKTISESYFYYNLGLSLEDEKDYLRSEENFNKALEILKNACQIPDLSYKSNTKNRKNLIYFLYDFEDYLYELCLCQINLNKLEDYEETLGNMENIKNELSSQGYQEEKADISYDITLLKVKNFENNLEKDKKGYKELIEIIEKCLVENKVLLSNEQKAKLKVRLAIVYLENDSLDKYNELIKKAIDLDPDNKAVLKIIGMKNQQKTKFLSNEHWWEIAKSFSIPVVIFILIFAIVCLSENYFVPELPGLIYTLFIVIVIVYCLLPVITFIYPIISRISISNVAIDFADIPHKDRKSDFH
ncbi:Tetratricopeptide TPR_1 repeat-containing protein [Thermodesulfobium narugense DSM 14796]|uniref:Tetratricopeptide TPR_1 repeat-containing protein n=1 Tax=Thermodesulfobium narugense DSM 14796 TaxID=747365 RepID=M1E7N3_9BACT|nr:hypothetical protein [Thermodesulfobium narugense]AEE14723.1 Tetratricopeptide TPR_1 repeat-containing protein [Thermodesulfobium narugense DSM 14796]